MHPDDIVAGFLEEAKHITDVHRLKADAKKALLTIKMEYSGSVSEYYQRLFQLREHAETDMTDRVDKSQITMRPSLSNSLLGRGYKDINDCFLRQENAARSNRATNFRNSAGSNSRRGGSAGAGASGGSEGASER